jgi:hypothetical protein
MSEKLGHVSYRNLTGTSFTFFISTKVQILTTEESRGRKGRRGASVADYTRHNVCWRMLTYADVC